MFGLIRSLLALPFRTFRTTLRTLQGAANRNKLDFLPIAGLTTETQALILFSLRENASSSEVPSLCARCAFELLSTLRTVLCSLSAASASCSAVCLTSGIAAQEAELAEQWLAALQLAQITINRYMGHDNSTIGLNCSFQLLPADLNMHARH